MLPFSNYVEQMQNISVIFMITKSRLIKWKLRLDDITYNNREAFTECFDVWLCVHGRIEIFSEVIL